MPDCESCPRAHPGDLAAGLITDLSQDPVELLTHPRPQACTGSVAIPSCLGNPQPADKWLPAINMLLHLICVNREISIILFACVNWDPDEVLT